jgi:hypothetical protein
MLAATLAGDGSDTFVVMGLIDGYYSSFMDNRTRSAVFVDANGFSMQ